MVILWRCARPGHQLQYHLQQGDIPVFASAFHPRLQHPHAPIAEILEQLEAHLIIQGDKDMQFAQPQVVAGLAG